MVKRPEDPTRAQEEGAPEEWTPDDEVPEELEVALEISDVLDLHSFLPRDVPSVVEDYLDAAYQEGFREVRIIHGRGKGVQRRTVHTLLERDPRVQDFGDAPLEAGGWGATWVEMK